MTVDTPGDGAPLQSRHDELTPRQREVCALMSAGLMSKQIAERLGMSINTVKTHRTEIFRKMGARSLLDLARMMDDLRNPQRGTAAGGAPAMAPRAMGTPRAIDVLVIEDDDDLRAGLVTALHELGHTAAGVAHGDDLEALLAARPYDVVLLDIGLGNDHLDGYALARRLRRGHRCGVVMTTARGERAARIEGLQSGADAYLVKPVDFEELDAVLHSVMRRLTPAPR